MTRVLIIVLISLCGQTVWAQEEDEERRYGRFFNGAFVEASARGGLTDVTGKEATGWLIDAGLRQALVMHLLDTRLAFRHEEFEQAGIEQLSMNAVEISGAFHPLYLALLYSDWWGYVVASWYVELHVGVHVSKATLPSRSVNDIGLTYGIGTGLDIPITDPDRGWSLWLNFLYRYRRQDFDVSENTEVDLHGHTGFGGIALRFNGLLF